MSIQLPQLDDARIRHFSACAWFDKKNAAIKKLIKAKKHGVVGSRYSIDSHEHFIHVYSDDLHDEVHLHINIATRNFFEDKLPADDDNIDAVTSYIERFIGQTSKFVFLTGVCLVAKNELPPVSLASGLLGRKAKSTSGEILTLREAVFTISGEPYDRVEWRLLRRRPNDNELFRGTLYASFHDYELQEDMLAVAFDTIRNGVNRFILEQTEI